MPFLAVMRGQLRYWRSHRLQVALVLMGVVVGVAVYTAIRSANQSALDAFHEGMGGLSGKATHRVYSPGGGGVPESVFPLLVSAKGVRSAVPIMEARARLAEDRDIVVTVSGVDLATGQEMVAFAAFGADAARENDESPLGAEIFLRLIGEPGTALVAAPFAASQGLAPGDEIALSVAGQIRRLTVIGQFEPPGAEIAGSARLLIVDPATFQEVFGRFGRLDEVRLTIESGAEGEVRSVLPAGLTLEPVGSRAERVTAMTASFRLNLEALGLFSLVVAVFLIFNAATFSVLQRRSAMAIMRCLGANARAILVSVLGEALIIGFIGGLLGVFFGGWLASMMVAGTASTIFELFLLEETSPVEVQGAAGSMVEGVLLGIAATMAGALVPALEAARVPPLHALRGEWGRRRNHTTIAIWTVLAVVALGSGGLLAWPDRGSLVAALLAAILVALGGAMLAPLALTAVGKAAIPLLGRLGGAPGRLAGRNLVRYLGRSGIATASLMVALSLWLAISITVGSFRKTFELWLDQTVSADIYIAPLEDGSGSFTERLLPRLRQLTGVRDSNELRRRRIVLGDRHVALIGIDIAAFSRNAHLPMDVKDKQAAYTQVLEGAALVSETLAYPLGLRTGDTLSLPVAGGTHKLTIAAVVQNYSAPSGIIYLDWETYQALYGPEPAAGVALWTDAGTDRQELIRLIEGLPGGDQVRLIPNAGLRESALQLFDRTFAITAVMRNLAAFIAFVAVVSALTALLEERRRILGYMRAIGLSRRQLGFSLAVEAGLIAFTATLLSWGVGLAMSVVLIFAVNKRAFGWTLQFHPAEGPYLALAGVALGAALLGSLYPIREAGRLSVSATIREE